jgi:hypothetical protein
VVVAGALVEVGVAAVVGIGRRRAIERIAQRVQHGGRVAGGHDQRVGGGLGDRGERHLVDGARLRRCRGGVVVATAAGGHRPAAEHRGGSAAHAAAQQRAARQAGSENRLERRVGARVQVGIVFDRVGGDVAFDGCIHLV